MQITDEMAIRCICAVHDEIARGDIGPDFSPTVWPGDFDDPDEYLRLTKVGLTAALAAAPPVAAADVEDLLHNLGQIAEFYEESWSGEVATDAATLIRSLHARAVVAEAERDKAKPKTTLALYTEGEEKSVMLHSDGVRLDIGVTAEGDACGFIHIGHRKAKFDTAALKADRDEARALLAEAKEALRPFAADQLPDNNGYWLKARISRDGTPVALTDMAAAREHARDVLARLDAALTGDAP